MHGVKTRSNGSRKGKAVERTGHQLRMRFPIRAASQGRPGDDRPCLPGPDSLLLALLGGESGRRHVGHVGLDTWCWIHE